MASGSDGRVLGLFAKEPRPGSVKTRLAAQTSKEWAAQVAEAFLLDTLDRLAAIDARRILAYSPARARAYFHKVVQEKFALIPQAEGDLGKRMAAFFGEHADAGHVLLVGTDSPTLPIGMIGDAYRELHNVDVVLGPATDGGYYLIGSTGGHSLPLDGIPWSSSSVLHETIRAFAAKGLRLALLPPWYDVDTLDDWKMLQGHVAAQRLAGLDPGVPRTEHLLQLPIP